MASHRPIENPEDVEIPEKYPLRGLPASYERPTDPVETEKERKMTDVEDLQDLINALYKGKERLGEQNRELIKENEKLKEEIEGLPREDTNRLKHIGGLEKSISRLISENREILDESDELRIENDRVNRKLLEENDVYTKRLDTHRKEIEMLKIYNKELLEEGSRERRKVANVPGLLIENEKLIDGMKADVGVLNEEVMKLRKEIKELKQENMNGRELLDSRSNEIDGLIDEIAKLKETIAKHNERMGNMPQFNKEQPEMVEGLRHLAEWFDALYAGDKDTRVQKDLRKWASEVVDLRGNEYFLKNRVKELEKELTSSYEARKKLLTHSAEQSLEIKNLKRHNEEVCKRLKDVKEQYETLEVRYRELLPEKRGVSLKVAKDKEELKVVEEDIEVLEAERKIMQKDIDLLMVINLSKSRVEDRLVALEDKFKELCEGLA